LRRAGGDVAEGAALAPSYDMAADTFLAVAGVVYGRQSDDGEDDIWGTHDADPYAAVDDRLQAHFALSVLEGRELAVTRYARGFETGEPLTDGEVVEVMSEHALTFDEYTRGDRIVSRLQVLRARNSALGKMR